MIWGFFIYFRSVDQIAKHKIQITIFFDQILIPLGPKVTIFSSDQSIRSRNQKTQGSTFFSDKSIRSKKSVDQIESLWD